MTVIKLEEDKQKSFAKRVCLVEGLKQAVSSAGAWSDLPIL